MDDIILHQLYFACPFSCSVKNGEIPTCAISKFRKLTYKDFVKELEKLSPEEVQKIIEGHFSCLKNREKETK